MSRQVTDIERRIAWTRFDRATDKTVMLAMARWFCWRGDGRQVRFTVTELARKAGVPKRSTERALERLEADWWIEITARTHRRPTTYRIVLERLATRDPEEPTLTATVADSATCCPPEWRTNDVVDRQSGGQDPEWRTRNGPDFEKVADQRSEEEVRTERSIRTPSSSEEVRHSGGQRGGRPEHPDVPAFLAWAIATYPQHASGAHLVLDRDRDGHLVSGLLEHYPVDRLQAMTVTCWTIEADRDPLSHASWIARSDRSLRVLRHKAAFLERVVVGAQQLTLGPMTEHFTASELAAARLVRTNVYNGCPHEPRCAGPDSYASCVREIAWLQKYGTG